MALFLYIYLFCFLNAFFCDNKYLLYNINHVEGFNLRRDVYIRVVNFLRLLDQNDKWVIVLPPWNNVYHWNSFKDILWSDFFDINSLNIIRQTIEYKDLYEKFNHNFEVDLSIILKSHPGMLSGDFSPKADVIACNQNDEKYKIFNLIPVKRNMCLNIRMDISEFADYFNDYLRINNQFNSFYIHDAEKLIHGKFSEWSEEYWTVRRSMIFSKKLRSIAHEFRNKFLDSSDVRDRSVMPDDWRIHPWPLSPVVGGPYLGAHLRRGDFVRGREEYSPTLEEVVEDLVKYCTKYKLNKVFMATDASEAEKIIIEKKSFQFNITILYFKSKKDLHDGETAIVHQIIASHGRAFIGTFLSTFTFRIVEERQIMGFSASSTHNCFCPARLHVEDRDEDSCSRPTVWPVKLESTFTLPLKTPRPEL